MNFELLWWMWKVGVLVRAGAWYLYRCCISVLLPLGCVAGGPQPGLNPVERKKRWRFSWVVYLLHLV